METSFEWLRCRHWIEAALEHALGTHTIDDIEAGIAAGRFQFWAGRQCAAVTEIIIYPRLKALNYFLIGGDLKELVADIEPAVSAWGKENGCSRSIGIGRKGFERAFRNSGYTPAWYLIVKEL